MIDNHNVNDINFVKKRSTNNYFGVDLWGMARNHVGTYGSLLHFMPNKKNIEVVDEKEPEEPSPVIASVPASAPVPLIKPIEPPKGSPKGAPKGPPKRRGSFSLGGKKSVAKTGSSISGVGSGTVTTVAVEPKKSEKSAFDKLFESSGHTSGWTWGRKPVKVSTAKVATAKVSKESDWKRERISNNYEPITNKGVKNFEKDLIIKEKEAKNLSMTLERMKSQTKMDKNKILELRNLMDNQTKNANEMQNKYINHLKTLELEYRKNLKNKENELRNVKKELDGMKKDLPSGITWDENLNSFQYTKDDKDDDEKGGEKIKILENEVEKLEKDKKRIGSDYKKNLEKLKEMNKISNVKAKKEREVLLKEIDKEKNKYLKLASDLDKYKFQIQETKQQFDLEMLKNKLESERITKDFNFQLFESKNKVSNLETLLSNAQKNLKTEQKEKALIQKEKEKISDDNTKIDFELKNVKNLLRDREEELKILNEKINENKNDIDIIMSDESKDDNILEDLEKSNEKLENEKRELELEIMTKTSEMKFLQTSLENEKKSKEKTKLYFENSKKQIEDFYEKELNKLKEEITKNNNKIEVSTNLDETEKLNELNKNLHKAVKELEIKEKYLQKENKQLLERIQKKSDEFVNEIKEKNKLQNELSNLKSELTNFKLEISTKEIEIDNLKSKENIDKISKDGKLKQLQLEKNKLESSEIELKRKITDLELKESSFTFEKKKKEIEILNLQNQMKTLKEQMMKNKLTSQSDAKEISNLKLELEQEKTVSKTEIESIKLELKEKERLIQDLKLEKLKLTSSLDLQKQEAKNSATLLEAFTTKYNDLQTQHNLLETQKSLLETKVKTQSITLLSKDTELKNQQNELLTKQQQLNEFGKALEWNSSQLLQLQKKAIQNFNNISVKNEAQNKAKIKIEVDEDDEDDDDDDDLDKKEDIEKTENQLNIYIHEQNNFNETMRKFSEYFQKYAPIYIQNLINNYIDQMNKKSQKVTNEQIHYMKVASLQKHTRRMKDLNKKKEMFLVAFNGDKKLEAWLNNGWKDYDLDNPKTPDLDEKIRKTHEAINRHLERVGIQSDISEAELSYRTGNLHFKNMEVFNAMEDFNFKVSDKIKQEYINTKNSVMNDAHKKMKNQSNEQKLNILESAYTYLNEKTGIDKLYKNVQNIFKYDLFWKWFYANENEASKSPIKKLNNLFNDFPEPRNLADLVQTTSQLEKKMETLHVDYGKGSFSKEDANRLNNIVNTQMKLYERHNFDENYVDELNEFYQQAMFQAKQQKPTKKNFLIEVEKRFVNIMNLENKIQDAQKEISKYYLPSEQTVIFDKAINQSFEFDDILQRLKNELQQLQYSVPQDKNKKRTLNSTINTSKSKINSTKINNIIQSSTNQNFLQFWKQYAFDISIKNPSIDVMSQAFHNKYDPNKARGPHEQSEFQTLIKIFNQKRKLFQHKNWISTQTRRNALHGNNLMR